MLGFEPRISGVGSDRPVTSYHLVLRQNDIYWQLFFLSRWREENFSKQLTRQRQIINWKHGSKFTVLSLSLSLSSRQRENTFPHYLISSRLKHLLALTRSSSTVALRHKLISKNWFWPTGPNIIWNEVSSKEKVKKMVRLFPHWLGWVRLVFVHFFYQHSLISGNSTHFQKIDKSAVPQSLDICCSAHTW